MAGIIVTVLLVLIALTVYSVWKVKSRTRIHPDDLEAAADLEDSTRIKELEAQIASDTSLDSERKKRMQDDLDRLKMSLKERQRATTARHRSSVLVGPQKMNSSMKAFGLKKVLGGGKRHEVKMNAERRRNDDRTQQLLKNRLAQRIFAMETELIVTSRADRELLEKVRKLESALSKLREAIEPSDGSKRADEAVKTESVAIVTSVVRNFARTLESYAEGDLGTLGTVKPKRPPLPTALPPAEPNAVNESYHPSRDTQEDLAEMLKAGAVKKPDNPSVSVETERPAPEGSSEKTTEHN